MLCVINFIIEFYCYLLVGSQVQSSSRPSTPQGGSDFEDEEFEYNNNSSNHIDGYDCQDDDVSFNWSVDETFELIETYKELKPKFDEPYSKKAKLWKKVLLLNLFPCKDIYPSIYYLLYYNA